MYSKTWLFQNSVIQNIVIIQILVWTYVQGGKILTILPSYFENPDNS
jgi:hypothetical protein